MTAFGARMSQHAHARRWRTSALTIRRAAARAVEIRFARKLRATLDEIIAEVSADEFGVLIPEK